MPKEVGLHSPREGSEAFSFLPLASHEMTWMSQGTAHPSQRRSLPLLTLTLVIVKATCRRLQLSKTKENYQILCSLHSF